jgi:hypothetical protein
MKNDLISRKAAIEAASVPPEWDGMYIQDLNGRIREAIEALPPAKPDYTEVLGWLVAYHTKSFELKGRYHPYEAIGWLVHDFAKIFIDQGDQDADND